VVSNLLSPVPILNFTPPCPPPPARHARTCNALTSVSSKKLRQVTRFPVQLWRYSWATTSRTASMSASVLVSGEHSTNLELKMFRPLFSIAPMVKSSTGEGGVRDGGWSQGASKWP
jgi:hypothetical protein